MYRERVSVSYGETPTKRFTEAPGYKTRDVNPNRPFERNYDAFSMKLVDLSVYLVISTNYFAAID